MTFSCYNGRFIPFYAMIMSHFIFLLLTNTMCYVSFSGPFCSLFECVLCFKDEVAQFDAKISQMGQYGSVTF